MEVPEPRGIPNGTLKSALNDPRAQVSLAFVLVFFIAKLFSATTYNSNRLGENRLWSLITGQTSIRWKIDKYAAEGYAKFNKARNEPFVLNWWGLDCLFMPPKYLDDIRQADAKSLSFFKTLSDAFNLHASVGDLYTTNTMIDVVKRRLNPQLPALVPLLVDESNYAFEKELGKINEWKTFKAMGLCSSLLHRVTSRVLIGTELCRNEEYVSSSMKFSESVFMNGIIMSAIPLGPFRRLVAWVGSFNHRRNLRKVMNLLVPVVEKRIRDQAAGIDQSIHNDATQWSIELAEKTPKEGNPERIAHQILQNLWAGSGAPGGMVTQMVYQTLMYPEYVEPMRAEVRKSVDEFGWTDKALSSMKLVDSFIKETNRMYPNGSITAARTVMDKSFTFRDGFTLPAGSRFAFPIAAIMADADNFDDSNKFNGFRHLPAEEMEGGDQKSELHGAATITKTNLAFGYGKHACVGRFYAVRKVKLVFAKLILDYELSWATQVSERPPSMCVEGQFVPNMEQEIRVRSRKV